MRKLLSLQLLTGKFTARPTRQSRFSRVPYSLIVISTYIVGEQLDFVNLYAPSLLVWIIGLSIFWLPSLMLTVFGGRTRQRAGAVNLLRPEWRVERLILVGSWVLALIIFIGFLAALSKGLPGSESFTEKYSTGLWAHASLISKFFFVYLLINFRRKNLFLIILLALLYMAYGSKGWIIIPILSAVIAHLLIGSFRPSLTLLFSLLAVSLSVFYFSYSMRLGEEMPEYFFVLHFLRYLFSGVLGLSSYIADNGPVGVDPSMLITPLVNLYNVVVGHEIINTYSDILDFIGGDTYTNVKTLFGTIYIYGGLLIGIPVIFIYGFFVYTIFRLALKTRDACAVTIYAVNAALLFFGWFDTYLSNLFVYEFTAFGLFFYFLTLRRVTVFPRRGNLTLMLTDDRR